MNNLKDILTADGSAPHIILRSTPYAAADTRAFLEDVLALANAAVEGPRYIVIGAANDEQGVRTYCSIDEDELETQFGYAALVSEYIEPSLRLRHMRARLKDKLLGVFEIAESSDKPYLMRTDFSETLRRGDGWMRVSGNNVKLGRKQLQEFFEQRLQESIPTESLEIGFAGEFLRKECEITTTDLTKLPSLVANTKLRQLLKIQDASKNSGSTTILARLTHTRLFGSDNPYEDRNAEDLRREIAEAETRYKDADDYFLFEEHYSDLQLVVVNHGANTIQEATIGLIIPNHSGCRIADQLPMRLNGSGLQERPAAEQAEYPAVRRKADAIHVSYAVGDLPPDTPLKVFRIPLRLCADNVLKGRRMGIHYSLFGRNLRAPVKGKLRLQFKAPLL